MSTTPSCQIAPWPEKYRALTSQKVEESDTTTTC